MRNADREKTVLNVFPFFVDAEREIGRRLMCAVCAPSVENSPSKCSPYKIISVEYFLGGENDERCIIVVRE